MIFRLLLFVSLFYLIFYVVKNTFLKPFKQGYKGGPKDGPSPGQEGKVSVDTKGAGQAHDDKSLGEYIDYEELTDEEEEAS